MACGVHLGILLICLVQAEHVRSWSSQDQSSQRLNSNGYVGFSQQNSGLSRFSSNNPQNQLRQASVLPHTSQRGSSSSQSGFSQGHSSNKYSQSLSQPVQSRPSSVRLVQSSSVSRPSWQPATSRQVEPKKSFFGLSTNFASASSVSKYDKQKASADVGKNTWPVKQGASKYPSSSSASLQRPASSNSKLAYQSVALKAPSASTGTSAYGKGGSLPAVGSTSQFSPLVPSSQKTSGRVKTSATAPGRKVRLRKQFSAAGGLPRSYKSTSSFQPRSPQRPSSQRFTSRYSQGERNQPQSGKGAGLRYHPTRIHDIPERFGGFSIRRLKGPEEQKKDVLRPLHTYMQPSAQAVSSKPQIQSFMKPQQITEASAQAVSYKPQVQSNLKPQTNMAHPPARVISYRPKQTYSDASAQTVSFKPQAEHIRKPQTYSAPSSRVVSYQPQVQDIQKSLQSYNAPSAQAASYKPQVKSNLKPPQTNMAHPPAQIVSYKSQQILHTPQVQSVDERRNKKLQWVQ